MGLGPATVGFISDILAMPEGGVPLRYAMLTVGFLGGGLASYFFFRNSLGVQPCQDLNAVEKDLGSR